MEKQTILITGASGGIGKQLSLSCAAKGANILLLGRKQRQLEHVYDAIVQQGYQQPTIIPFDLSTATLEGYEELMQFIKNNFHSLEVLIHNAALVGPLTPIEHYSPKQWYEVLQINLHAPFHLTQTLLPLLKKAKTAQIIFTLDKHFTTTKAYWGAYGISKRALHGLMQTLAQELKNTSVHVNAIYPGPMQTGLRAKAYPGENTNTMPPIDSIIPTYMKLISNKEKIKGVTVNSLGEPI